MGKKIDGEQKPHDKAKEVGIYLNKRKLVEEFVPIYETLDFLALSYESFIQNRDTDIKLYTKPYYAYHYFSYINFLYSLKEKLAQFINKYLELGIPESDVSYHTIIRNENAALTFKGLFDYLGKQEICDVLKDRKLLVHRQKNIISIIAKTLQESPVERKLSAPVPDIDMKKLDKCYESIKIIPAVLIMVIFDDINKKSEPLEK